MAFPRLRTKFTEICGVEAPLMMGGMHYVGYAELAAHVSNAGGLGVITALTQPSAEDLRKEIKKAQGLTKKPFGVNLTLLPALTPPDYDAYAQVVVDEGVKIVETAGNNPEKFIAFFKKHDITVIHKCVAVKHALTAQRLGADIVSLDGFEAGGHPGEMDVTNWVLFAQAMQTPELKIPYIASGACATGSHLAASFALGCEGMNMGTRWMCTQESKILKGIKDAMKNAQVTDTTLIFRSLANTERVYKNKTAKAVQEIEATHPGDFAPLAPYVKGLKYKESFYQSGDHTDSVWSCGMSVGLIKDEPTCADLVKNICTEAHQILTKRLTGITSPGSKL